MMSRQSDASLSPVALAVAAVLAGLPAAAAGESPAGEDELEQVIVTGTRRAERTVLESPVPVDVLSADDLQSVFTADLNNKLQSLIPSYTVKRTPPADGSIFVRPAALRNLSPDHTLVLVNGKRFHRSAFVDVTSRGAQAVDLSLIPAGAFKRLEVLRDGAAAQYGSDAIAGVLNFILDDEPGTDGYVQYGEYSKGDGENLQVGASSGFRLGASGHLNIAAEYIDGKESNTGIQRPQAAAIAALGEPYASAVAAFGDVVQRFGVPDLEQLKLFVNSGWELANGTRLYAFGNFSDQSGVNDFNYRASRTVTGPNADGNIVTFQRQGSYARSRYQDPGTDGVNTWAATYPDWNLAQWFPGGFTPRFGSDTRDFGLTAGIRGSLLADRLDWDLSASLGSNRIDYPYTNTVNSSLGPDSPTEFDAGSREQREQNANLDFVYQWQTALAKPVNVGFGFEWRREEFRIRPGEWASWAIGPLRDLGGGSNGFAGAHPDTSGAWDTRNTAAYVELDADVSERFNVTVAGRIEDHSLFGSSTNGKLAARFELTPAVSLRGAVSTGFRAPTPGQQYLYNVSQSPNTDPLIPRAVNTSGTVPSNGTAAALFGGRALEPEESVSLSLGLVLQPLPGLAVTVDAYQIDVDDRISLSTSFELTDAERAQLEAIGAPFGGQLTTLRFYTNSFDTRTKGIDVVGSWRGAAGPGRLGVTLAANANKTSFRRFDPGLFNEAERTGYAKSVPKLSTRLGVSYDIGKLGLSAYARHFGKWTYVANAGTWNTAGVNLTPPVYQGIGAETLFDLIGTYRFSNNVDLTVGVENVFDNYVDKVELLTLRNNGRQYPGGIPFENEGRQLYARVGIKF